MSPWVIEAVTSVRVGDGTAVGLIDLPVAREVPTGWPILAGSAIKGALRGLARWDGRSEEPFGAPDRKGELEVCDAVLLALPVRSAAGGPALVTCPLALARLARVWPGLPVPEVAPGFVVGPAALRWTARNTETWTAGLEDLDLVLRSEVGTPLPGWRARLAERLDPEAVARLCLVHDDLFAHAAAAWTELQHRNALKPDGTVEDKKLFTVERCPPGTLWWTMSRGLRGVLRPDLQLRLGGHRGGGSGRVVLHPLTEEAA